MSDTAQDLYLTVESALRAPEFKVKGSSFISDILPVANKEAIDDALTSIRKEFYDATHHCFAYRLGPTGSNLRAADDGEPSGTAGRPILLVLTSAKLTDTLIVVTRYYGGTKLGTGGLARAYAEAAQQAVSMAKIKQVFLMQEITLTYSFDDMSHVERMLSQYEAIKGDAIYLDSVQQKVQLRRSRVEPFIAHIVESLNGRVGIN
ncbi:MAG TPA: YigZ family protein [Candidatus Kapabacteria bacterium]|nr:YigZ family protein [Candidatus Kapabacteria bacterium]